VGGELATVVLHGKAPVLDLEDEASIADDLVKEATAPGPHPEPLRLGGAGALLLRFKSVKYGRKTKFRESL